MLFQKRWITAHYGAEFHRVQAEIEKIGNQRHLKRIALEAAQYEIRMLAIEKIADQQFLIDAAKNDRSIDVRIAALKRIKDGSQRLPIALDIIQGKTESDYYRIAAIETVLDEYDRAQTDLLEFVSRAEPSSRLLAAKHLDDKDAAHEAFLRVAKDPDTNSSARNEAIRQISDGEELLSVVMAIRDGEAALSAARKIPDEEKQQLAYHEIATAERFRLNDQLDAAVALTDRAVRDAALRRIMCAADARTNQKSGTYTWQDQTMLQIASRCKVILDQDGVTESAYHS